MLVSDGRPASATNPAAWSDRIDVSIRRVINFSASSPPRPGLDHAVRHGDRTWRLHPARHGTWTAAIGEFEALCSLACFAHERPNARSQTWRSRGRTLTRSDSSVPSVDSRRNAVANDVKLGGDTRLWIVSGSNMSGKSTLLRAIG